MPPPPHNICSPAFAVCCDGFLHTPHAESIQIFATLTFIFGNHFGTHPLGNMHLDLFRSGRKS
jgi:hypothetical protein